LITGKPRERTNITERHMTEALHEISESEACPKCGSKLPPRFSTGRVVCGKCGWTNQPKNVPAQSVEKISEEVVSSPTAISISTSQKFIDTGARSINNFGWLLFVVGSCMLGIGLIYDPTVESGEFGSSRTYNIGAINIKSTYTNTGGFIAVCGAIFATYSSSRQRKESKEDSA
jgi:ribosomal protein L37AE/L43A